MGWGVRDFDLENCIEKRVGKQLLRKLRNPFCKSGVPGVGKRGLAKENLKSGGGLSDREKCHCAEGDMNEKCGGG